MNTSLTYRLLCLFLFCAISQLAFGQEKIHAKVLVVGAGAGGTAAALQSASMGVQTILTEETIWLGGMLTSAGVSAIDGNHQLPSGIWGNFRNRLYQYYGGAAKVETGWVSNTLFEPHVGDSIFKSMAAGQPNLKILYQHRFIKTLFRNKKINGAVFLNLVTGKEIQILAQQTIDATELGDVMAAANVPHHIGMEASSETGELVGVPATNNIVQDLTYAAILKDYGPKADCTIVKPTGYNAAEFDASNTNFYNNKSRPTPSVDAQKMLSYGKLPNKKYMLNWPTFGNDIYLNILSLNGEDRKKELETAKEQTKRFIYFIQSDLGFKNLGLADDEFPTADRFPFIPYHREGRRLVGLVRLRINDIATPFYQSTAFYRTGISVGDYPIDHHHKKNDQAPQHLNFYPIPSYNIPLGALIPKHHKGLIVAEKGISVSNVVNGTTRLQPVVLGTGQAAGALAALSVQQKKQANQVSVRTVQTSLLQAGAYIMPYSDVKPSHLQFLAIQKIGATGLLKGTGTPNAWANRTWFYPDSLVKMKELEMDLKEFNVGKLVLQGMPYVSINDALLVVQAIAEKHKKQYRKSVFNFSDSNLFYNRVAEAWSSWGLTNYDLNRFISRAEFAVMVDKTLQLFNKLEVNHNGNFLRPNTYKN